MIHTDLKPENVAIALTKKELKEIYENGVLKTTKMYNQNEEQIYRAVAGAHDEIILSQRENAKEEEEKGAQPHVKQGKQTSDLDVSKDYSEMTGKDKKRLRKKKRKQIKKYIKQGKLPAGYDNLPQDERDRLYLEVRKQINEENLKREGLFNSHAEEAKEEAPDFKLNTQDIGIGDTTNATDQDEPNREDLQETKDVSNPEQDVKSDSKPEEVNGDCEKPEEEKKNDSATKPRESPTKFRHSSVPRAGGEQANENNKMELEKLKNLISNGLDEPSPSKPEIPKLNTNLIPDNPGMDKTK